MKYFFMAFLMVSSSIFACCENEEIQISKKDALDQGIYKVTIMMLKNGWYMECEGHLYYIGKIDHSIYCPCQNDVD